MMKNRPFLQFCMAAVSAAIFMLTACTPAAPPSQQENEPLASTGQAPAAVETQALVAAEPGPLPTFTPVPTPAPGMLLVDASQDLGPISPLVYGSNYGPWLFVTLEMRPQAIGAKISFLRYPGGNWGDLNDLDPWMIDQYIALCQEMGSIPSISVRMRDGTPEKAAALVRYTNIEKGYGVKYWAIGNEPSLFPNYDTERYNREWRQIAGAMLAVDDSILFIGPEPHQFTANMAGNPKDPAGRDWLVEFLKENGDMVDIVAVHRYPFPKAGGAAPSIEDLRANSPEWDENIAALKRLIRETTGRDIPVGVTEVNSSWASNSGGEATMDSLYNAIWWADSLGRMIRQKTEIVAQFALVGELGLMGKYKPYPMLFVYYLYQRFGSQLVYASSDHPDLSIFAALNEQGELTLMAVNRGPGEISYPFELRGFTPSGPAEVWRLDKDHNAENLGAIDIAPGGELTVPGQSVSLYIFPGQ